MTIQPMDKHTAYPYWLFFLIHAGLFAVTMLFMIIINIMGNPKSLWFFIPLLTWGLVIYGHFKLTKIIVKGTFVGLDKKVIEYLEKFDR